MQPQNLEIIIQIPGQSLSVLENGSARAVYPVSTAANGPGFAEGSYCTPTGRFRICDKIGDGCEPGTIFRGRVPTGETGTEETPGDCVQTRILWLDGLDPENANTRERYIYIHGTNRESEIGKPASMGCIRMRNADMIELYHRVDVGTLVHIHA